MQDRNNTIAGWVLFAGIVALGGTIVSGEMFAAERRNLEGQWDRGDDVSTEELRVALTRYRAFFDRLLAI